MIKKKEFDLLLFFFEHINMVVTKEELIKKFWTLGAENSRSIDMHVKALRQKIFHQTKLELITLLKVGYKLIEK